MNDQSERDQRDTFDRVIGTIHGLPDVDYTRPSTVTAVLPIVGRSQTYVVQTYRSREGRATVFLQMVDSEGRARIVIPDKVADAIYRQREQLVKKARRRSGREKYERRRVADTIRRIDGRREELA